MRLHLKTRAITSRHRLGSFVLPLGVSRKTLSSRFGCIAQVAFGMKLAGSAPLSA